MADPPTPATPARTASELAVEDVASSSYGRLLAYLAASTRDLSGAEDALADALERAVITWPERGVPANPEAWVLTAARRRLIDGHRRREVADRAEPTLRLKAEERGAEEMAGIPDKRLELLFVCAHPAIDARVRAPLMLQTVLGLDAARIASAFLVAPSTMSQRLVRAKRKILDAGIAFRVPEQHELADRLDAVLDAIYGAFGTGWELDQESGDARGLAEEGVYLARMVMDLLPGEVEAEGLLALVLFSHSRRHARRDETGRFVPLAEQDTGLWDTALIAEAEDIVTRAARRRLVGPFTLEALIQATHACRAVTGETDWATIVSFYDTLLRIAPTTGAEVAAAAATLEARGPADALARLDAIEHPRLEDYQPWWAVRAHALVRLGHPEAADAINKAAGLSSDPAVRAHLLALLDLC